MASLLELNVIERDSTADPGSPPDADIVAAREFRARVRMALLKRASAILTDTLPVNENQRGPALEMLAWAQRTVTSPDVAAAAGLRIVLARSPSQAARSAILETPDAALEGIITPVLALLAKGMHPGRR